MKFRTRLAAWRALCIMTMAASVMAQEDATDIPRLRAEIAKVKRDIAKAEIEIRRADSLMREEANTAQRNEERVTKDRERREKEIADLQKKQADIKARIEQERRRSAGLELAKGEYEAKQKNLRLFIASWCDSLLLRVDKTMPLELEGRLERVRALKNDLASGSASADEGLSRFSAIVKDEVKSGDEIALLNRPLSLPGGETVNAQILKVGNQFLLWMDEDGKRGGYQERIGAEWKIREVSDFQERQAIKKALDVKAAKQAPQLVPLNLTIAPVVKEGGKP